MGFSQRGQAFSTTQLVSLQSDLCMLGYNIETFGAKGDGDTARATANTTAINAAIVAKSSEPGGGIVYVPSGKFIINDNIVMKDNVLLVGEGYASWIQNIATSGFSKCNIVSGNIGDVAAGNGLYNEIKYNIQAATAGDAIVTLSNPSDAANFHVGDIVGIASYEVWSLAFPDNHEKLVNLNEVVAISGSTITLRYALKDDYSASVGNPTIRRITGSFNAYGGKPMFAAKNCGAINLRLTQATGLTSGWYAIFPCGVNQHYENIWMDDSSSMFGSNGLSNSTIRNVQGRFEAAFLDLCDWQNSNLIEDVHGVRFAANPALNRIGAGINNGSDIICRNVTAALNGYGGFSYYLVYRGVFERCTVTDAGSDDAVILGFADDCEACASSVINPKKNGIVLAGKRHRVYDCRIPSVGAGGYSVLASSAVDVCFVHDNEFGTEGSLTPNDRFYQATLSPNAVVYNNTGYVEREARKGRVNWAGNVQTQAAAYVVLKTTSLKGTSGIVRGFRVLASGAKSGNAGTKDIKLCLGGVTIASASYTAADNGTWELSAVISVRTDTNAAHVQGKGIKSSSLVYNQQQIIANGLLSDTTLTIEGQVANAADVVACNLFIVEPLVELLQ